jgi:hypothetical protein
MLRRSEQFVAGESADGYERVAGEGDPATGIGSDLRPAVHALAALQPDQPNSILPLIGILTPSGQAAGISTAPPFVPQDLDLMDRHRAETERGRSGERPKSKVGYRGGRGGSAFRPYRRRRFTKVPIFPVGNAHVFDCRRSPQNIVAPGLRLKPPQHRGTRPLALRPRIHLTGSLCTRTALGRHGRHSLLAVRISSRVSVLGGAAMDLGGSRTSAAFIRLGKSRGGKQAGHHNRCEKIHCTHTSLP